MLKFLLIVFSILFVLFPRSTVFSQNVEFHELGNRLRTCGETWCRSVANAPSLWPQPCTTNTISIEVQPTIVVDIPAGFLQIRKTGYFLMFIYKNKKVLTMEELSKEAFPELSARTKNARLTMADAVHATFTRTPKDTPPACPDDAQFWYWAMFFKMTFFENSFPVFSSQKGPLTVYYLSSKRPGMALVNDAVIINDNNPEHILKLKSTNMTLKEFKSIIGTTREKRNRNYADHQ